jgi:hypothetical protein
LLPIDDQHSTNALGPILLGVNAAAHIVAASVTVRGLVNMTAVTVCHAQVLPAAAAAAGCSTPLLVVSEGFVELPDRFVAFAQRLDPVTAEVVRRVLHIILCSLESVDGAADLGMRLRLGGSGGKHDAGGRDGTGKGRATGHGHAFLLMLVAKPGTLPATAATTPMIGLELIGGFLVLIRQRIVKGLKSGKPYLYTATRGGASLARRGRSHRLTATLESCHAHQPLSLARLRPWRRYRSAARYGACLRR